ncbi:uncharacterized protein LOC117945379 [Etheostoma cragini]|uniref:uncharacterized protein LOC117945379 n=1 Tax=Etheostoma cragini TaxID=417921 RepID=UPI00155ED6C7|nr:uncharacterized protein LOC117945379 [Etheostoma cragini]XP_034728727.1 uncharacterized protein LOC117945379 [Etheostoma cragini]
MSLSLYECLTAVGLQHHYARFTSVGVHRAAHLSALTLEDYAVLGIRSMEDRTRLFHLVQMVKTLDLECEDSNDYNSNGGDAIGYAVADSSFTYDGCGDRDEDLYDDEDAKGFSKPSCVRRRLDFSSETIDDHLKLSSRPEGTVHVHTSHYRKNVPGQGKGSAIPVQLDTESASVYARKEKNNHRPDVHSHQSDHHTEGNTMGGNGMYNSHIRLLPKCESFHQPKPRPATAAPDRFSSWAVGQKDNNVATEHTAKPTPVYESKRTAGYNYGLPLSSPPVPNKKPPGGQRISVCVRKRPLTSKECREGASDVVTTPSGECLIVHERKEAVDLTQYILQHRYYFDQVFGEDSSNEEVYRRTAYPLVQHMLNGGKATCFAYGQTGAGKTHTMLGSPVRPGLYALAVRDIFAHLTFTHIHSPLLVYVSFFEIYCGQLYDLLDHRERLFAREDGQKVVHIVGLRDVRVDSVSSLLEVISQGTEERTQGTSGVNSLSSRSHALLQIQLRDTNQQIAGRMWFVDLAGSERASDTKEPDRQSRVEGAEINQSLLALKECIRSLDQEQSHTPFRQSKLTQVLKDSFVGDSMTCMIANISPGHIATEHTLNTLRYADRVKELRGQGGLRRGRRGKTIPSPKRNLSNSNSSNSSNRSNSSGRGNNVGTRGKSPPKKPKLWRQREDFGPTMPSTRLATGCTIFCSTPKNSRRGEETSARARKGIGLEHITPVRGLLGKGDKRERRERANGREGRRRERYGGIDSVDHSVSDQNIVAGLVLGQATDVQLHSWKVQRESGFYQREKNNQKSTLKGGVKEEKRWIEQRRQVENRGVICSEVERLRERDLQKVDERHTERARHLRQYHKQLQQFMPSSVSSSVRLFSPSTCTSSSNQASICSSVSPSFCSSLQQSSRFSDSALIYHGLEEVLDSYRARVEVGTDGNSGQSSFFPSGQICSQTETSPSRNTNKDDVGCGDFDSCGEDWSVSMEGTEARFGQVWDKSEKKRSLKATGEGEGRVRREEWRPAGMEEGEDRRWAWVAKTETEQADRMTGAVPAVVEALERREVGEEGLNASDVPADGVWRTEEQEGADSFGLLSTRNAIDRNRLFNRPPVESSHQQAPAERPLSPACGQNALLTPIKFSDLSLKHTRCPASTSTMPLPLQNAQQGVPSSSCREKQTWLAAHANRREISKAQSVTLTVTTPITKNVCKIPPEPLNISKSPAYTVIHNHPKVKAKMSVLPQEETADSLGYIMDPLSISLLQVDQQVATASFLKKEQYNTSTCPLEDGRADDDRREMDKECLTCAEMAGKVVADKDVELHLSFLELPQAKTHCPPIPDTTTATNDTERMCCATHDHFGIDTMKPPIAEVMLVSLRDKENNQKPQTTPAIKVLGSRTPGSPLNPSACASVQTSVMQSISSSVYQRRNTGLPSSHKLTTNHAIQMPPEFAHNMHNKLAFSISSTQSESVLGQLNTVQKPCHTVNLNHFSTSNISLQPNGPIDSNTQESTSNQQIRPKVHLSALKDLDHDQWRIVQSHWNQLEEMDALCRKEGALLYQQPDMAFREYVHKLEDIMDKKARCVHSMIAQLQPYLQPSHSNQPHNQKEENHGPIT